VCRFEFGKAMFVFSLPFGSGPRNRCQEDDAKGVLKTGRWGGLIPLSNHVFIAVPRLSAFCVHRASAPELNQLRLPTLQPTFLRHRLIRSPRWLCYLPRKPWILPSGKPSPWLSTSPPVPVPDPEHRTRTIPAHLRRWAAAVLTTGTVMSAPRNTVVAATAAVAPRAAHQAAVVPAPGVTRVAEATVGMGPILAAGPVARVLWRSRLQRQAYQFLRNTQLARVATIQSTNWKLCRLLSSG
jgi:hypothetical protein